jgi:hypothetical protein
VGEEVGAKEQNWASTKARFYTLTAFTLWRCRHNCFYELVPSLELSDSAKTINVREVQLSFPFTFQDDVVNLDICF